MKVTLLALVASLLLTACAGAVDPTPAPLDAGPAEEEGERRLRAPRAVSPELDAGADVVPGGGMVCSVGDADADQLPCPAWEWLDPTDARWHACSELPPCTPGSTCRSGAAIGVCR